MFVGNFQKFDSKPPSMASHPTTINCPIACSSQGKSCWTVETTTWRTYDLLKRSSMMILKHSLTTLEQKVTKKKTPIKDRNARTRKKIANKGKVVLDNINKEVAKWERLLDKFIFLIQGNPLNEAYCWARWCTLCKNWTCL